MRQAPQTVPDLVARTDGRGIESGALRPRRRHSTRRTLLQKRARPGIGWPKIG